MKLKWIINRREIKSKSKTDGQVWKQQSEPDPQSHAIRALNQQTIPPDFHVYDFIVSIVYPSGWL